MKWKKRKILDISNPRQWKNIPLSEMKSEGYLVYGANGIIGRYSEYNHEFPTIVITCRGATCGNLHITEPYAYINSNAMALDDLSKEVDIEFLYYALKKIGFKNVISGSAQPQITREGLSKISLYFPENLDDQIRIATVLTRAEKLITKRKESIKALDELLKSTFLEMFGDPVRNERGWEKETLRNLSIKFSDGPFGSNLKTCHYEETGIRVIRLKNIGINKFIDTDKAFISQKHFDEVLYKYICLPGDVVIATMGDPNIRACIIPEDIEIAVNKADCVLCRPNKNKALPEYITGIMNLPYFLSLASNLFHGQTRTRVSMGQLATLEIPLPPLPLQNQFAAIVEKVESLKAKYNQSLTDLENFYGSLSQRAFKGELDLSKVPLEE